ncbi:DUF3574 domain-containing protein [Leptolyngbya sp. FACHB-36]|uniref:DUF3574 domain-containing protein n=1 Tax=Leptolyngbya sp. FACHB-36 TaxID=2692808 RepID=UPI001681B19A|nr:DUF3574 domain-containing protein [Leptolyngbya sp. FACHB-36]MBD2021505.1 DUF3574 domain-containing protein [Leptolyngbya sp. FACHB-36]
MNKMRRMLIAASLVTGLTLNIALAPSSAQQPEQAGTETLSRSRACRQVNGEVFARTELFFGLSKSDGSTISEEDFQDFVDREVTGRFPDGLTLLSGSGQFRDSNGTVVKEGSKLLILLYPFSKESSRAIQDIRAAYVTAFQQQSVLRVDEQSCVSF